jgi:hypothetical protein
MREHTSTAMQGLDVLVISAVQDSVFLPFNLGI